MINIFKLYLPFSFRAISYTSTLYFTQIVNATLERPSLTMNVIFYVFGLLVFEFCYGLVVRYYHSKTHTKQTPLSAENYQFRYQQEKYLLTIFIYFLISLATSLVSILLTTNSAGYWKNLLYGGFGLFIGIFNFIGFALIVSHTKVSSKSQRGWFVTSIMFKVFGFTMLICTWVYIFFTLNHFNLQFFELL